MIFILLNILMDTIDVKDDINHIISFKGLYI